MIRAVLFDVSGTLLTGEEEEEIYRIILAERGVTRELDAIREAMKNGGRNFIRKYGRERTRQMPLDMFYVELDYLVLRELDIDDRKLAEYVHERWFEVINLELYDDTKTVLNRLSAMGLQPGIISNGYLREIDIIMEKTGLKPPMFSVIVGRDTAGAEKPDPRPFLHAAGSLGLRPDEILFVGDSYHKDYEGSQGAGMMPVLILRGKQPPADAPDEITTVQTLDEVMDFI